MKANHYQNLFEQEYEKLNPEQKEAVDTIYGPVMVIAGPGTGKTQILSLRIANLLLSEAQVQSQNILCLTYTEEGKKNMHDRLFKLVGAETAQYIQVHTYHSFCNSIIQQNLALFQKESLDAVSELEKIQYIKEILLQIPKNNLLYNPKNPTANAKYLLSLFSKMKQENWDAHFLTEKTKEHIYFLENDESSLSKTGKRKGQIRVEVLKQIEAYQKSLVAIQLFDDYKNLMLKNHRYDFDDMINWVITLFQNNPDVLANNYERFQYILVDEFQDTNGAQMEIIHLLSSYDTSPNLFVVGDDDQSIYRFQGASVENMQHFQTKYAEEGLKVICLKTNYRSYTGILDVAKNLIENAGGRLINTNPNLDKNLLSHSSLQTGSDFTPTLSCYPNPRYEKIAIAKKIQALLAQGVAPKEIAVLYYDNNSCIELGEYLTLLQIPFYSKKKQNLLEDPFAQQIITILKYISLEIQNPYSADDLLFEILHYHFFRVSSIEIAKASILSSQYNSETRKRKNSFRLYLQEQLQLQKPTLFTPSATEQLYIAAKIIEDLLQDSLNLSFQQLMDAIIEKCNLLTYIFTSKNKYENLEILTALFDYVKEETHRNPSLRVTEFMEWISLMEENNLALPRTKLYGNEEAVRLFTVHASKGREFEYVFVAGCVKTNWEEKRTPSSSIKIPDNVFETALNTKDHDELRRIMYVALTRAKKELHVSYYSQDNKEKEMEKSLFLYEIFGEEAKALKPLLSNEEIFEFSTLQKEQDSAIVLRELERDFVNKQLEKFEMNVSALNHYLKCPLHFYYNNIVRIPSGLSENMSFGSAIHHALEHFFADMKTNNNEFATLDRFKSHLLFYMNRNKEKFSPEGFKRKLEYGYDILENLYTKNLSTWEKNIDIEVHVSANINGIPIKGFIDKIEYGEIGDTIVDYKTGDPTSVYAKDNFKSIDQDKDSIGGDYWRQAIFYKILLDNQHPRKYKAHIAKYEFVEPDKKTKLLTDPFYVEFTEENMEQVKEQITTTWQKIQSHDFYTGCGKDTCTWCNLAKQIESV